MSESAGGHCFCISCALEKTSSDATRPIARLAMQSEDHQTREGHAHSLFLSQPQPCIQSSCGLSRSRVHFVRQFGNLKILLFPNRRPAANQSQARGSPFGPASLALNLQSVSSPVGALPVSEPGHLASLPSLQTNIPNHLAAEYGQELQHMPRPSNAPAPTAVVPASAQLPHGATPEGPFPGVAAGQLPRGSPAAGPSIGARLPPVSQPPLGGAPLPELPHPLGAVSPGPSAPGLLKTSAKPTRGFPLSATAASAAAPGPRGPPAGALPLGLLAAGPISAAAPGGLARLVELHSPAHAPAHPALAPVLLPPGVLASVGQPLHTLAAGPSSADQRTAP
jgi:hypothetical protein